MGSPPWGLHDCVAAGCGAVVKIWAPGDATQQIKLFEGTPVFSIDFSRNNRVLAVAGDKGQVQLYSSRPGPDGSRVVGTCPRMPEEVVDAITCVRFAPNDAHLVGGCKNGSVHVWSLKEQEGDHVAPGLVGAATSLAINPSMTVLATASVSGQVLLHDFKTGVKARSLLREGPAAGSLGFSSLVPNLLCAANAAGQLLLWDVDQPQLEQISAHKAAVTGVAWSDTSPDLLLSCGADGVLKATDRRSRQAAWSMSLRQPLTALAAKWDGSLVAVGTSSGTVAVHDARTPTARPLSVQQFSDDAPVTALRWQHMPSSKASRAAAAASASVAASAGPPSAHGVGGSVGSAAAAVAAAAAGSRATGGGVGHKTPLGSGWPAGVPALPGSVGLMSEASSTSDAEFGMRAVSPVRLYGSPGGDSDAAGGIAAAGPSIAAATPEQGLGGIGGLLATPADSGVSGVSGPGGLMFTPVLGMVGVRAQDTPVLAGAAAAGADGTPVSRLQAAASAAGAAAAPAPALPATAAAASGGGSRPGSGNSSNSTRLDSKPGRDVGPPASGPAAAPGASKLAGSQRAATAAGGAVQGGPAGRGAGTSRAATGSTAPPVGGDGRSSSRSSSAVGVAAAGTGAAGVSASRRGSRASEDAATGAGSGRPNSAGAAAAALPPQPPAAPGAKAPLVSATAGGASAAAPPSSSAAGAVPLAAGGLREDVFKTYVDQQLAELRQDVRNMHLDMLRQFHQAQMDLVSVVDGLAQRQEQLAEAMTELSSAVNSLRTSKQQALPGVAMVPWI